MTLLSSPDLIASLFVDFRKRLGILDKTANADGQRRRLAVPDASPTPPATGMAPLLRQLIDAQEATGLPPAYLPKESE